MSYLATGPRGARYMCDGLADVGAVKAKKARLTGKSFPREAFIATKEFALGATLIKRGDMVVATAFDPKRMVVTITPAGQMEPGEIELAQLCKLTKSVTSNPQVPKDVRDRAWEFEQQGKSVGEAFALAWSIHCKYTDPGGVNCQKGPKGYFRNPAKIDWALKAVKEGICLAVFEGKEKGEDVLAMTFFRPGKTKRAYEKGTGILAHIRTTWPKGKRTPCYGGVQVKFSATAKEVRGTGFGGFMYSCLGSIVEGWFSDRDAVSDDAIRLYTRTKDKRHIRTKTLDNYRKPKTRTKVDDCKVTGNKVLDEFFTIGDPNVKLRLAEAVGEMMLNAEDEYARVRMDVEEGEWEFNRYGLLLFTRVYDDRTVGGYGGTSNPFDPAASRDGHIDWLREAQHNLAVVVTSGKGYVKQTRLVMVIDPKTFEVLGMVSTSKAEPGSSAPACLDGWQVAASVIHPELRGKGFGSFLYEVATYLNPPAMYADRSVVSEQAESVWERFGGRLTDFYVMPFDDVYDPQTPPLDDDCFLHGDEPYLDAAFALTAARKRKIKPAVEAMLRRGKIAVVRRSSIDGVKLSEVEEQLRLEAAELFAEEF